MASTDGSSPNRSFDQLWQGGVGAQLQPVHLADTSLLPPGKILEMMTIDSARAIEMDESIGSIEVGKRADLVALDWPSVRTPSRTMIPLQVNYLGEGCDMSIAMVDGYVLMRDRRHEQADRDQIVNDAGQVAR